MATTPLPGQLPGNSKAQQQKAAEPERPKVKAVIAATERKKSLGRRIADSFTGEDAKSVGSFIVLDVLLPAFKTMISDAASQGVERMLFGTGSPRPGLRSNNYGGYGSHTPYNRVATPMTAGPSWGTTPQRSETISRRARATHDFREVLIPDRQSATLVLDQLQTILDQYQVVTVADFYDTVSITSDFTDNKWGWDNLLDAQIVRVNGGYIINFPQPRAIQ